MTVGELIKKLSLFSDSTIVAIAHDCLEYNPDSAEIITKVFTDTISEGEVGNYYLNDEQNSEKLIPVIILRGDDDERV